MMQLGIELNQIFNQSIFGKEPSCLQQTSVCMRPSAGCGRSVCSFIKSMKPSHFNIALSLFAPTREIGKVISSQGIEGAQGVIFSQLNN
jgi:hypothetical protein